MTAEELQNWLKIVLKSVIMKEVDERWHLIGKLENLTDYLDTNYGALKYCKNSL